MRTHLILASLLMAFSAEAQYNTLGLAMGSSAFRGETTADGKLIEEPGLNLNTFYTYWLPADERWQITAKINFDYIRGKRQSSASDGSLSYDANSFLFSVLGGMRFYIDNDIRDYVPEKNQGAFFGGLYAGPILSYSNYITPTILNPALDTYSTQPTVSLNIMAELGYRLFINKFWAYELSLGLQGGGNDRWDGYKGNTGVPDFILQASFGLSYSFYALDDHFY